MPKRLSRRIGPVSKRISSVGRKSDGPFRPRVRLDPSQVLDLRSVTGKRQPRIMQGVAHKDRQPVKPTNRIDIAAMARQGIRMSQMKGTVEERRRTVLRSFTKKPRRQGGSAKRV